ncbi:MAG: hypothetical protein LBU37_13900 [Tannerellaceae bacterium]|nr:hypothetical protein [Tannerellaceae bacterium]
MRSAVIAESLAICHLPQGPRGNAPYNFVPARNEAPRKYRAIPPPRAPPRKTGNRQAETLILQGINKRQTLLSGQEQGTPSFIYAPRKFREAQNRKLGTCVNSANPKTAKSVLA